MILTSSYLPECYTSDMLVNVDFDSCVLSCPVATCLATLQFQTSVMLIATVNLAKHHERLNTNNNK